MKNNLKYYVFYAILIFGVTGCMSVKKAKTVAYNNPKEFAEVCATLFPIKENTVTEKVYIKADNKDLTPELTKAVNERDSALKELSELQNIADNDKTDNCIQYKEQLPQLKNRIVQLSATIQKLRDEYEKCKSDTVTLTKISTIENTAKLSALQTKFDRQSNDNAVLADKLKSARNWMYALFGIIALGGIYTFLKIKKIL